MEINKLRQGGSSIVASVNLQNPITVRFIIGYRFSLVHFIFYFIGKENLDLSDIRDAIKNDGSLDSTRVVVEEQLKIRRKSPRKKEMNAKCPSILKADSSISSLLDRSPSLTDRHSIESVSRNGTSYFSNFINNLEFNFLFLYRFQL